MINTPAPWRQSYPRKLQHLVKTCIVDSIWYGNMPLPWQRTFGYCRKMRLAHLQPKAHMCAKFHGNRAKTEKGVCNPKFSIILAHNIWAVTMATHFLSLSRNVSCWPTSKDKHSIWIPWELEEHWWSSFAMKHFALYFANNMPLPWQHTFCHCRNMCLAH